MGLDSSALRSELSFGHFGTSAEMSRHFGPICTVPKCLDTDPVLTNPHVLEVR